VGLSQYSKVVEKSRLAEARTRIGTMRQLAYQYYLEHGSLDNMQYSHVGVDTNCSSAGFFRTWMGVSGSTVDLMAQRCTSGGKTPDISRQYNFYLHFDPGAGTSSWRCYYPDDYSSCFGLLP